MAETKAGRKRRVPGTEVENEVFGKGRSHA
jgi:hypothetical protein